MRTNARRPYRREKKSGRKKKWMIIVALVAVVLWVAFSFWPATDNQCRNGVSEARTLSWYALPCPGGDTLYFNVLRPDSMPDKLALTSEEAQGEFRAQAFFVSFSGRLLTASDTVARPDSLDFAALRPMLEKVSRQLAVELTEYRHMIDEMDYYGHTHTVVDDGFHMVMERDALIRERWEAVDIEKHLVDTLLATRQGMARLQGERFVYSYEGEDSVACRLLGQVTAGPAAWQTMDKLLPPGCGRFRLNWFPYRWFHFGTYYYKGWGRWGRRNGAPGEQIAPVTSIRMPMTDDKSDIPLVAGADGAPVFGRLGNLNGMWVGGRLVHASSLYGLTLKGASWHVCVWEDLCGLVSYLRAPSSASYDSTEKPELDYGTLSKGSAKYYGQLSGGAPHGEGVMKYAGRTVYSGSWKNGVRAGYGEYTDTLGRVLAGIWEGDTLPRGRATDREGTYFGHFNASLRRHGDGELTSADGGYYAGEWKDGQRDGFGFSLMPRDVVKCGVWAKDRFKGEHMLYHAERIYGIDISKYQHMYRRKWYDIDWRDLRVTYLGRAGQKRVNGVADYPVSFVYIKSTEGLTVVNPYYLRDLRAARRYGYPVGAYHFFTTRSAQEQADHFLKKSALRPGDLPPMLDVELSNSKIESMGGADVLFKEMLVWLKIVGERTGTEPVIYMNQNFVNNYFSAAPEELKAYPVWVARYGEYKPYVHLRYWQLSPEGKVNGIRSNVDVNVFNGTKDAFLKMVEECAVK